MVGSVCLHQRLRKNALNLTFPGAISGMEGWLTGCFPHGIFSIWRADPTCPPRWHNPGNTGGPITGREVGKGILFSYCCALSSRVIAESAVYKPFYLNAKSLAWHAKSFGGGAKHFVRRSKYLAGRAKYLAERAKYLAGRVKWISWCSRSTVFDTS